MVEQQATDGETRRVDVLGVTRLDISWKHGTVTLISTPDTALAGEQGSELVATVQPAQPEGWTFERQGDRVVLRQGEESTLLDAESLADVLGRLHRGHSVEFGSMLRDVPALDVTVRVLSSIASVDAQVMLGDLRAEGVRGHLVARVGRGNVTLDRRQGPTEARVGQGSLHAAQHEGQLEAKVGAGDVDVADLDGRLELKSGVGSVTAHQVTGSVDAKVGRGDVTVRRLAGTLDVTVGDGAIVVEEARDGELEVKTGKGDVRIQGGAIRSLHVKSGLGGIVCDAALAPGGHDLRTGLGDISVMLATSAGLRVDAATGWGDVRSDFPLVRVGRPGPMGIGGQRFVGSIGAGPNQERAPGGDLKLRAGKGSIQIRRARAAEPSAATPSTPYPSPHPGERGGLHPSPPVGPGQERRQGERAPDLTPGAPSPSTEERPDLTPGASRSSAGPSTERGMEGEVATTTPEGGRPDPRLAVLQALRRGEISVEEAERMLEILQAR
ncbi:MAG: DUF4097 family beta strand repeat protein [Chloroflexi bacterium]|nr:DUF4097 family beta strand repeat protein [Chloroflexota bacterium]